jgi:hypothetical protein
LGDMEYLAIYRTSFEEDSPPTAFSTGAATNRLIEAMLGWEQHLQDLARRIAQLEERVNAVAQPALAPLTVRQIVAKYPAYTIGSLRWALFHRKTNGLDRAVIQKGRRVLLDEVKFLEWIADGRQSAVTPRTPSPRKGSVRTRSRR